MGIFTKDDSRYFWLYLETTKKKERTDIRCDAPTPQGRKDNRAAVEALYHDRLAETRPSAQPDAPAVPSITFAEFVTWYQEHVLPKHRGAERERVTLPRLVAEFGALTLADITPSRVTEWQTRRLAAPTLIARRKRVAARAVSAGPVTVNRETDVLKAVMQAAVPKYFAVSPLFGMKRLATKTPRRTILSEADEAKLLAGMPADDAALMVLALDSLIRLHDVLDIKREHHDGRKIWIDDPKAGGGFHVPISARAKAYLAKIADDGSGYYFSRRRAELKTDHARRNAIKQMLQRACKRAGVKYGRARGGITFHWATRRTGATRMLSRGVQPGTVQKVGRWKTLDTVLTIYDELIGTDAIKAVNAVGAKTGRQRSRPVPAKAKRARKPKKKRA